MKSTIGKFFSSPLKIIITLIILGALSITGLELTNTTHLFHSGPKSNFPTTSTKGGGSTYNQKGQSQASPSSNSSSSSSTTNSSTNSSNPVNKTPGQNTANTYLITPWGNFVSNHHPGQNGTPLTETSVCNTTQGATCDISFTNGTATESLPAQVASSNGATFWSNWSLSSIGLTPGNWKITATATLDGQTKTATDPMELVVPQ